MLPICWTTSPLGEMLLIADVHGNALSGVHFAGEKYFPGAAAAWPEAPQLAIFRRAVDELREYFAGERTRFDVALAPAGTAFQRGVWTAIAAVPFGETITYGELARRCGHPSAVRAAGAATGRNPITIMIPCHRIMGSGGALTGYAGGLSRKRALLALEGHVGIDSPRQRGLPLDADAAPHPIPLPAHGEREPDGSEAGEGAARGASV